MGNALKLLHSLQNRRITQLMDEKRGMRQDLQRKTAEIKELSKKLAAEVRRNKNLVHPVFLTSEAVPRTR